MSDRRFDEIEQANGAVPRLPPSPADVEYLLQRVRRLRELGEVFATETKNGAVTCLNCKRFVGLVASSDSTFELAQSGVPSPRDRKHETWCPLYDGENPSVSPPAPPAPAAPEPMPTFATVEEIAHLGTVIQEMAATARVYLPLRALEALHATYGTPVRGYRAALLAVHRDQVFAVLLHETPHRIFLVEWKERDGCWVAYTGGLVTWLKAMLPKTPWGEAAGEAH